MAKTETQINLKINKGTYAKIQENLSQIGEDELIIADDVNIPMPDELNEGKGIISHNNKYVFEDVQLKNLITDIETHKTENGSYPSTKAVYDYCQTLGITIITIPSTAGTLSSEVTNSLIQAIEENKPVIAYHTVYKAFLYLYKTSPNSYCQFFRSYVGEFDYSNGIIGIQVNLSQGTAGIYSTLGPYRFENLASKKTSVSSYPSSNTYYPTTKAVYDFVKGETKYLVVSDYSALPTTNVAEGTLAYCQYATVYEATDYQDGFYIYKNSSWTVYPMGIGRVVFDKYNQTNFDITQTYSWAYNDSDVSDNFTAITTMASNGGLLQINFNDDAFLFNYSGISQTNKSSVSMVVIYDNKQYIATVVVNNTDLSNMFTLSFQEIEGGSSGGEVATKKWYEWKFADGMLTSNEIIFKLNEDNFNSIVSRINAMMKQQDPTWQDISTSQEVVALYDQLKLLNDSTTIFALAYFLYNGALDSDTIPYFYRDEWQKREILSSDMYVAGTTNTQNATPYCFLIVDVNDNHTYEYVNLNASSTLVITETEETIGGGSSTGGGSGKLYELSMELTRYDENGDQVGFGSLQNEELGLFYTHNQDYTLNLTLDIYESNFEKIKIKLNAFIDLVNQQAGGSIPHLTDINSLVSLINSTLNESVADEDTVGFILLNEIIPLCDNAYYSDASTTPAPHKYNIIGVNLISWTIGFYNNNALNCVRTMFSTGNDDIYYALNAHNSCTLTEYGTSGGGGASAEGIPTYRLYFKQNNEVTLNRNQDPSDQDFSIYVNRVLGFEFESKDIVSRYNEFIQVVNSQYSTSFTTISSENEIANNLKQVISTMLSAGLSEIEVMQGFSLLIIILSLQEGVNVAQLDNALVEKTYPIHSFGTTQGYFDTDNIFEWNDYYCGIKNYGFILFPSMQNSVIGTGNNYSTILTTSSNQNTTLQTVALSLADDYDILFKKIETSGGSGSYQPTIPERFSLAYNLVVNINQEQFANGSWTGSNNDNIRTFQYNGSNADETKSKELVEFLTGVNVLDSYNATKPTPCFVFCTQSNICWKLQWDNSLLHAYKVENFPFVVKDNIYRWTLSNNNNELRFWTSEIVMQDLITQINQIMPNIDPNWQNITEFGGIINLFNTLKQNASDPTTFGLIVAMLGCGGYVFGDRTIYSQKTPIYFTKFGSNSIDAEEVKGIKASRSGGVLTILYKDPFGILTNGLITNDSSEASDGVYIDSNATLQITKQ